MKKGEIWKWVLLVIAILALFMKTYIGLAIWAICLYLYLKQRKKQKEEKEQEEKKKQEELAREKRERELEAQRLENERKAKFEAEYALYKEDAEQGKVEAMRNLGNAYRRYYKWSDAKYWYKKAAERNDVEALFALINDYAIFGTSQAKERADQMASNPYASDEEKRRAVLMKVEIERYEYKQKEEAEAAEKAVKILGGKIRDIQYFDLPGSEIGRSLVIIEKVKNTPGKYPRKAGTPLREPLA